jgi:hypothetical protein
LRPAAFLFILLSNLFDILGYHFSLIRRTTQIPEKIIIHSYRINQFMYDVTFAHNNWNSIRLDSITCWLDNEIVWLAGCFLLSVSKRKTSVKMELDEMDSAWIF